MKEIRIGHELKSRKLVLKRATIRLLDGKEAKAVIGGMLAHEPSCTCKCATMLPTKCRR